MERGEIADRQRLDAGFGADRTRAVPVHGAEDVRENAIGAIDAASSRACRSAVRRSCRRRSSSIAGNVGRSVTSASSGRASRRRATGTFRRTADESKEPVVVRPAPRNSTASAISSAEREPAPSSSIAAVRLAVPNLPAGSSPAPARTTTFTWTIGTSCDSTSHTARPFESARFCMAGRSSCGVGASDGGVVRSGSVCAQTGTPSMAHNNQTRRAR